jgi:hypothetical protein
MKPHRTPEVLRLLAMLAVLERRQMKLTASATAELQPHHEYIRLNGGKGGQRA